MGSLDYDTDCVEDSLPSMINWRLWLTNNMWTADPTGPFPKTMESDYIRIYHLKEDSINVDFYDNWANYDYGVWRTVKLGDAYSAVINDNGSHTVWATDNVTLDKGFEVGLGTEFEIRIYEK